MKLFDCQVCCQTLYFENTKCESCGHMLGYVPEDRDLYAVVRTGETGSPDVQIKGDTARTFKFCANHRYDVCNWLVPRDGGDFCLACRHNHTIPDLSKPGNQDLWRLIEIAKHRLFYTLLELNLPLVTRAEDPAEGLVFEFLEDDAAAGKKVMTGHDNGRITLAIAEADDAERERRRKAMGEPYRTLLGHFRHEIGHYYWDRLVRDGNALQACREVFGDDTEDYNEALKRHYAEGAPRDWRERFVSQYATTHAWEDFAETWAHYLHILDTLETAEAFGVATHPRGVAQADRLAAEVDFDPDKVETVAPMMKAWLPLTFALNSLNRSMGLGDLYPFILTPAIIDKLGFVHDLVHGHVGEHKHRQPDVEAAPVPENSPPPESPAVAGVG